MYEDKRKRHMKISIEMDDEVRSTTTERERKNKTRRHEHGRIWIIHGKRKRTEERQIATKGKNHIEPSLMYDMSHNRVETTEERKEKTHTKEKRRLASVAS